MSTRFLDVRITQTQLVAAALECRALVYSDHINAARDKSGQWHGAANCFGILLIALRECGALPPDFDLNLSPSRFSGRRPARTLWLLLHDNFEEVAWQNADGVPILQRGDFVMFRWKDVDRRLNEPHHVALALGREAGDDYGCILHALESASGGRDSIFVQQMDALDWSRIDSVWRRYRGGIGRNGRCSAVLYCLFETFSQGVLGNGA